MRLAEGRVVRAAVGADIGISRSIPRWGTVGVVVVDVDGQDTFKMAGGCG
jgi:hypothetical protein